VQTAPSPEFAKEILVKEQLSTTTNGESLKDTINPEISDLLNGKLEKEDDCNVN
jgi:hypothetical protein